MLFKRYLKYVLRRGWAFKRLHKVLSKRPKLSGYSPDNSKHVGSNHEAPKVFSASLSSLTAVSASSKLRAEIAHLACFWALAIAMSSVI
jgi:hypothetical protein